MMDNRITICRLLNETMIIYKKGEKILDIYTYNNNDNVETLAKIRNDANKIKVKYNFKEADVILKFAMSGREDISEILKTIEKTQINILTIKDITAIPHNSCIKIRRKSSEEEN